MAGVVDVDVDPTIAEMASRRRRKKVKIGAKKKASQDQGQANDEGPPGIRVSLFDYSVENHFQAVDRICKLCGEAEFDDSVKNEIDRLSSSITFLREWRHFNYKQRIVQFACQNESSPDGKEVIGRVTLPQFSAAMVPKKDLQNGNLISPKSSEDFVMYVGGSIWALDWCPIVHQRSDRHLNCEFIAVAAHPPESSYHKIGAPLIGRGVIQIWCLLNAGVNEKEVPIMKKKPKQNPRNNTTPKDKSLEPKRPRGRPRKKPEHEAVENLNANNEHVQALVVQFPEYSSNLLPMDLVSMDAQSTSQNPINSTTEKVESVQMKKPRGRPKKKPVDECIDNFNDNNEHVPVQKARGRPRKKPEHEAVENLNAHNEHVLALAVQFPENSSDLLPMDMISVDAQSPRQNPVISTTDKVESLQLKKPRGRPKKKPVHEPKKKPVHESVDGINDNNEHVQAPAIQFSNNSSNLLPMDAQSTKQNPRDSTTAQVKSLQLQKSRGRPRKKLVDISVDNLNGNNEHVQAVAVQFPERPSNLLNMDMASMDTQEYVAKRDSGRKRKGLHQGMSSSTSLKRSEDKAMAGSFTHHDYLPLLVHDENRESTPVNLVASLNSVEDPKSSFSESSTANCLIPKDVALPRVVLCLAHNGKVAWDVKWRPSDVHAVSKYRMGYLAVLLGNGALEVWEVPLPQTIKVIYSDSQKEGTDPRFVKLEPIFRCSKLKHGGRQSIPLTVEWSASSPHDFILAGCHDGVVALWKFSVNTRSEDTRPLLCFSADTVTIRALAWAPVESDSMNSNVIVTAGHRGLKFWDIRDPFRPLWDLNPVQRNIYSLDWLPDPRCVIVSFDDGTLRILSLVKAAYDVPVTGKPFVGTQQQGFHSYCCSSFAIWNIHVSRITGMAAYCSADGTVLHFKITTREVEKDHLRNRVPHYLCGSLSEEKSSLTVFTPMPDTPFPMKKSLNEWGNAPRTIRGFISESNQAKRAKETEIDQTSGGQTLALCYGDDPGPEVGSDDTLVLPKSRQTPKPKTSGKKKTNADQVSVCRGEGSMNVRDSEKGELWDETEVFPPKIVAMHRVRWNMNKGSERWLCYGGAGGILRCQEI